MDNKLIKVFSVVVALLLLIGMGVCVYDISMNEMGFGNAILPIAAALTGALGVYYVLAGCKKKDGAAYFKWFVNMFALVEVITMVQHSDMSILSVIMTAIAFGCLTVLSCALNLGEKKSVGLALGIVIAMALQLILPTVGGSNAIIMLRKIIGLLLGVTTVFMVFAKYADKKSRGSK